MNVPPHVVGLNNLETKIGWAYQHVQKFDALVIEYCGANPYTITKHDDLVNQRHVIRYEFVPVKADIALSLSDLIYALRSGLDQLAWDLSLLGNPDPPTDVMFPIHGDRSPKAEERLRRLVWDMPCEAVAIIKNLQPYQRGNAFRDHPLWQLNELSNIDKHRVPARRAIAAKIECSPGGIQRELNDGIEMSWPLSAKSSVIFKPGIPELVFGDPINSRKPIPLELRREEIIAIYNYVTTEVAPRFAGFFPSLPRT